MHTPPAFSLLLLLAGCSTSPGAATGLKPSFDEADANRARVAIALKPVASGLSEITDIQFAPGETRRMAVLQKRGEAVWVDLATGARTPLVTVPVRTSSEEGLLGLAFHPNYAVNHKIYLDTIPKDDQPDRTVLSAWTVDPATGLASGGQELLSVDQPYPNHDGGQIRFGPDGYLYIALGDGGSAGDPHGNGQDLGTLLGALLRIDVDHGTPYAIPPDNPFVSTAGARPELYAVGLRNPWRFSFDPSGQLIAGDVGQNTWEEIDVISAGDNLGWNIREGRHCYRPPEGACPHEGFREPVFSYDHEVGQSITGGVTSTTAAVPALKGWYVFGDYVAGRIWALDLRKPIAAGQDAPVVTLGKWPLLISTFGLGPDGTVYLADYRGTIYKITAP